MSITAKTLLERIAARGGRVFCMPTRMVFCLTTDEVLRDGLVELGGRYHSNPVTGDGGPGGYKRGREPGDKREWDIWIHTIPVEGETIYEAAGGKQPPLPTKEEE